MYVTDSTFQLMHRRNHTSAADDMTQYTINAALVPPMVATILIIISVIVAACVCTLFCIMVTTRYRKKDSGSYILTSPKENKRLIKWNRGTLARHSVEIY